MTALPILTISITDLLHMSIEATDKRKVHVDGSKAATRLGSSAYRISVEMRCNLLPAPEKNSPEWEELQRKVFEIPLKTFLDWDVVAREVDKFAVLLSSSCAVLPGANFRLLAGPYNEEKERFATRVGKNLVMNGFVVEAIGKRFVETSYPASFLSMEMKPGRNYSFLKNCEWKLVMWVDEAESNTTNSERQVVQQAWSSLVKKMWPGGEGTDFCYRCEHEQSGSHRLRANALYISANKFCLGSAPDVWSKVEVSPFPQCGNITENQWLIENGCPTFEVDATLSGSNAKMDQATREKVLCYLNDRLITILKDPSEAYPVTDKHTAAKEQLKRVAGGISVGTARMTEEDAQKQLASACQLLLKPCEPRDDRSSSQNSWCRARKPTPFHP